MSHIQEFLKSTGNEFASLADDGIIAGDIYGWYDTGSYALNALLSGSIYKGLAGGKGTGLAAESSVGKTFLALGCAKNFQEADPTALVMLFESESAISKDMLKQRGIDTTRFGVVPVTTIQDFRNMAIKVLDNYEKQDVKKRPKLMFILDSLGMLSTEKEMADAVAGNNVKDMTRASLVRSAFRVLTLRLGRAGIPMIVTNHVYANVTAMYGGNVASGGGGYKYAVSQGLMLTKAKEKDGDEVIGVVVTAKTDKSRLTKENNKAKLLIRYSGGMDRYYGLLGIAEDAGIVTKIANKYQFPDGTKAFEKSINNNGEKYWTKELLDRIDAYTQKEFTYDGAMDELTAVSPDEEEAEVATNG